MMLEEYNKYNFIDLQFIPKIPMNWNKCRLKDLGYLQNGVSKGADYFGHGYPFVSYGNVYHDKVNLESITNLANSSVSEQKLYSVKKGDVFFTRTSETIDEIGIAGTCLKTIPKAAFSGFVIRFRPYRKDLIAGFSKYFFKANVHRQFLASEISLVTRASLSQSLLNNLPVIVPPSHEQTQIANYLGRKTTVIDKKIELLQQKITKYQELRKSLINETVCRGLNKNTKLKDSGIKSIGQIPEHWEERRLKDIGNLYSGLSGKAGNDFNQESNPNNRGFIPFTNIANNTYLDPLKLGTVVIEENEKQNKVKKNDLFFLMSSEGYEDIGKTAILNEDIPETYLNSFCKGFRLKKNDIHSPFLNYLLLGDGYRQLMIVEGKGFTRINLKMEKVKDFIIYIPEYREQLEIAEYIDIKTSKIDQITTNIKKQIEVLKELRKTLINDVVTGKLKVVE